MSKIKISKIVEYLLYIFVFLIPWQTRYIYNYLGLGGEIFEYGKLSFYLNEVFLFGLIFFSLFYLKSLDWKLNKKNIFSSKIIFLFLLVSLISFAGVLNSRLYFYGLVKLIEAIVIYVLILKINFSYIKLGISFVASMFLHSLLAIYQFFSQSISANKYLGIAEQISNQGGVSVLEGSFGRLLRAYGGLSHPNILGGFLVIAILILIGIFLEKNKKPVLFCFTLIILFFSLILSFSRSAGLALGISLILLFIYYVIKKTNLRKIFLIFIVLILVSGISSVILKDFIQTRIQGTNRLEVRSTMDRETLQVQAFKLLNHNWFLGRGINNYIINVYKNVNSGLNVWEYQPVHNVYLLIWVELGILGLILYLILIFYNLYKSFKSDNINKLILGLILLSILIISFWDHYFYTYSSALFLFFLIISLINKKRR